MIEEINNENKNENENENENGYENIKNENKVMN